MARRRRLIAVEDINDYDDENWVSRGTRRREKRDTIMDLRDMAEGIVTLSDEDFERVPLNPDLRKACADARGLNRNSARKRLIRHIADLLVGADQEQIGYVLAGGGMLSRRMQLARTWRGRLLAGDASTIEQFLSEHPLAERQRVRQLLRQTSKAAVPAESAEALDAYLAEFMEDA